MFSPFLPSDVTEHVVILDVVAFGHESDVTTLELSVEVLVRGLSTAFSPATVRIPVLKKIPRFLRP